MSIDDDEVELPAGEVNRTLVDNEVTLVIPDVAQVRVSAGPDSKDLADRRSRTQQAYQRLCDEAGVTDLDKARAAAQQRREALRNREEADKAIQRELRDLTAEGLLSKVKGLTRRVDSYPQERSADADLPEDYDTARRTRHRKWSARLIVAKPYASPAKRLLRRPLRLSGSHKSTRASSPRESKMPVTAKSTPRANSPLPETPIKTQPSRPRSHRPNIRPMTLTRL